MTATHYHDVVQELRRPTRSLREAIPGTWRAFGGLHEAAMSEGVVPARIKEVMALAIAVVKGCEGCIAYHAKAAAEKGATPDEVAEGLGVALLMDGGPASSRAPQAWSAYLEFATGEGP